jgi:hypothetical protein
MTIEERLEKIESLLSLLGARETVKDWYGTEEFGLSPFYGPVDVRVGSIVVTVVSSPWLSPAESG